MSCTELACGTGGWAGPKPGDPNNNVTLGARTVRGGIEVSWSYPTTNAHAVAHTLLYRGVSNDFNQAMQLGVVSGSLFFDQITVTVNTEYFYWIKIVSVNGTIGNLIGPASAVARPIGKQTMEDLTGLIDEGVLAQELKKDIKNIIVLGDQLILEIQDRISGNSALAAALAAVQSGVDQAMTFVQQEIIQRTEGDSALVQMLNTMAAAVDQSVAALFEEKTLRVTADLAQALNITELYAKTGQNTAAIKAESEARSDKDSALSSDMVLLFAKTEENKAAVLTEATARTNRDNAFANQLTTAQVAIDGNLVSAQTQLQTQINTTNGKVTTLGALYTAKVQVNGLIGGFGVYNDGTTVEAGFDVDRFWIGRTNAQRVKPFIIDNDVVYINKAQIRNADIDTLKIAGNAVTVPFFASAGGSASGALACQTEAQYLTAGAMFIGISNFTVSSGGFHGASATMYANGTPIGSTGFSFENFGSGVLVANAVVPADGWYTVFVIVNVDGGVCTGCSITGLGGKK